MTRTKTTMTSATGAILLVMLLTGAAIPAFGQEMIRNGIDLWRTPAGYSYIDFGNKPLPAGFFCSGSEPFAGRVVWGGVPLVTQPRGILNGTDTIVQRLDDAVFDDQGVALTRLQVRALSMASVEPIHTNCGSFDVVVGLADGEQPTTEMRIVREGEGGGSFESALKLNVRLTFTPVKGGTPLELTQMTHFPGSTTGVWSTEPPVRPHGKAADTFRNNLQGFVTVDTDGDGLTDLSLPGVSDFYAFGQEVKESDVDLNARAAGCVPPPGLPYCHTEWGECHCTEYPL